MKEYLLDTVALVRYLEDNLPGKADEVFRVAEQNKCRLLVPDIVFGEFSYISLKGRLRSENPKTYIMEVIISLDSSKYMDFIGMDTEAWEEFLALDIPELHDRMICSIASSRNCPVITSDEEIRGVKGIDTIWD